MQLLIIQMYVFKFHIFEIMIIICITVVTEMIHCPLSNSSAVSASQISVTYNIVTIDVPFIRPVLSKLNRKRS